MTDILFVQNYYEHMGGIMLISAVLKQHGFTTDLAIGTNDEIVARTLELRPRVIGFYCTTGFHHKSLAAAREIKRALGDDILTILGGPHPTFAPEVLEQEGVDAICRGEGEYAVLELMQALREGRPITGIENIDVKMGGQLHRNGIRPLAELDALPLPDREIYKPYPIIYNNPRQEVMFGRGCPFSCTFCSAHAFRELYRGKGQYVRFRSVENVMQELEGIRAQYSPKCFFFHDDIFVLRRDYFLEILAAYRERIGLPFACFVRADSVDEEIVRTLKESGCYLVFFGLESGSEPLRNRVLGKRLTDEQIRGCGALLRRYRIPFMTFNIVGLPDETLEDVWRTIELNGEIGTAWASLFVYQPLPFTKLGDYAVEKGYVDSHDVDGRDATFHENSEIVRRSPFGRQIMRLKSNANLIAKAPRALRRPLGKMVLHLPLDPLYALLDKFLFYMFYVRKFDYRPGLWASLRSGWFLARHLKEFRFEDKNGSPARTGTSATCCQDQTSPADQHTTS